MLANIIENREIDFSHLLLGSIEQEPSSEPLDKQQSSFIWIALILSSFLHISLVLFNVTPFETQHKQASLQTLHIELLQTPPSKPDVTTTVVTEKIVKLQPGPDVAKENNTSSMVAKKVVTAEKTREAQPVARLVIEPLSSQELTEIATNHNTLPDYENAPAIVKNVFHPELRKKLIAASKERRKKRVEDEDPSADFVDPSGAVRVETSMGTCLSTPENNNIGAPRNWYVSQCKGKLESEEMMERVEQSVNGKLSFDD
jgi:hypothetical protein